MGVRLLSKLLKSRCYEQTKQIHLSELYGKKICIDASIYLYRYKSQNALLEKIYLMCSLFRKYNIIPLFVFDGKPPKEKDAELEKRAEEREQAYCMYDKLKEEWGDNMTKEQKLKLQELRKSMIRITRNNIDNVKSLLDGYGIKHITAINEADALCANLVIKKKVFAVLTEDMDLFAYACPYILRYFSLVNHTCILYDIKKILKTLSISKEDFKLLCVLSGNDYYNSGKNIFYYMKLYDKFKKITQKIKLIDWLKKYNYLNEVDFESIENILKIYNNNDELNNYKYFGIRFGTVDRELLYSVLEKERFVF